MYTIKQAPEDFIVREVPIIFKEGPCCICLMKKKDYTTTRAVDIVARALGTSRIGYAGNKDKLAVTEQYISVEGVSREKIASFYHPDIQVTFVQMGQRLALGDLRGNSFEIVLRNVTVEPKEKKVFINYFGEQRFSASNIAVGRAIVKKDFKKAVTLIIESNDTPTDIDLVIAQNPNDYIGALRCIPISILSLYINAYQSYLWNEGVNRMISAEKKIVISDMQFSVVDDESSDKRFLLREKFPMIGFESEDLERFPIVLELFREEGISTRDFIIPQFKQLSAPGGFREICVAARDITIKKIDATTYCLSFVLPKGSYATVYIAQLFI